MRPHDYELYQRFASALISFDQNKTHLPGIRTAASLATFVEQLLESIHRVKYVSVIKTRKLSHRVIDVGDELFDPIKAAIVYQRIGNIDEAFWLVFLSTYFGKHRRAGWQSLRDVYGRLGDGELWNWDNVSSSPPEFKEWLHSHQRILKSKEIRGFGNHRKYETLDAYSSRGTGAAVESYVNWIGSTRSHMRLIENAYLESDNNPTKTFSHLYESMKVVASFGRTARFDYLTMIGNIGLANIEPGIAYLKNSTGPKQGARLLFGGNTLAPLNTEFLESQLVELGTELGVGMQVMEDALCNWQKSPEVLKKFRG